MPAKKKNAPEKPADESALVSAAKTIGKAAGKVAGALGVKAEHGSQPAKRGKPQKRNKTRLPRRVKKQMKKAAEGRGPAPAQAG
jgi:hypothetical protein